MAQLLVTVGEDGYIKFYDPVDKPEPVEQQPSKDVHEPKIVDQPLKEVKRLEMTSFCVRVQSSMVESAANKRMRMETLVVLSHDNPYALAKQSNHNS